MQGIFFCLLSGALLWASKCEAFEGQIRAVGGRAGAVANNCYGYDGGGASSGGYGLYAYCSANNCEGYNFTTSGTGLYANIAIGCCGYDYYGSYTGLAAFIGESSSGNSISVTHNFNCF
jgi:hypothetical protein